MTTTTTTTDTDMDLLGLPDGVTAEPPTADELIEINEDIRRSMLDPRDLDDGAHV